MNINSQKLSDLIHNYVRKQTKQNKQLSENRVSEQLGIPAPTFNRILNGRSKPSVYTLIKLSKYIPEVKNFLPREMFEVVFEKTNGEMLGEKLEALLFDPDMFLIYALAFCDNGITEDFIIRHFGSEKISKLKVLEKEGFVVKKKEEDSDTVVYKAGQKQITTSFKLIQKHIETLNKFYKSDKPENNYAFYGIDTLNKQGVLELMRANKEFHKKTAEIMNKKENKGDIPVFSTGISDMLFEQTIKGEQIVKDKEEGRHEYN